MIYSELLNTIKTLSYRRIAVTGLPRSGIGFAARCLSEDLGYTLIWPEVFAEYDYKLFIHNVCLRRKYVVACPGLLPYLHNMPGDVFIVVLNRDLKDVERSQARAEVIPSEREIDIFRQYKLTGDLNRSKMAFVERHIAPIKVFEYLDFKSLESHSLFIGRPADPPIGPQNQPKAHRRRKKPRRMTRNRK